MNALSTLAHGAWLAASAPSHRRFVRALRDPRTAQERVLRTNLVRNAASAYGQAHAFARITSYADFARRVPVIGYDELAPWIERLRQGQTAVLTREPVTRLMPTSGTTGGRKLIPFTTSLQREFNAAIGPWICDLARRHPAIVGGPGYWSVTPLASTLGREASAVPIGFDDDAEYLGGMRARLVERVMAVPSAVRHINEIAAFRHVVLLQLLRRRDLRLVSVWHPSFFALLLDALATHWKELLADLAAGTCRCRAAVPPQVDDALRMAPSPVRARELSAADPARPETIWPELRVVSCWADANAAGAAAALRARLPHVDVQPKGLLATEAFVTLPFAGTHPLALNSHFCEFRDERGTLHLADALRVGETYDVIVTTGGGLYRYALGDRVLVAGLLQRTPCLRFLGRARGSDCCGEKLSEEFVARIVAELFPRARFTLLAPEETGASWRYILFVEDEAARITSAQLDDALAANPHYALCRRLGQLKPATVFRIESGGYATFVSAETARGLRLGDIKPVALSPRSDWRQHFARALSPPLAN